MHRFSAPKLCTPGDTRKQEVERTLNIAVVGTGIAGLSAAWALHREHHVTVYETDDRLGGHAHTVEVPDGDRRVPVDTGFIVYNERNYPNLVRLFAHLGVASEPTDMSFAVSKAMGAFEYQARALGLIAAPSNLLRRDYRSMVPEIIRFTREAPGEVAARHDETTRQLLDRMQLSEAFRRDFLLPVVACIWSSSLDAMLDMPARSLIGFLENHGLLNVTQRPKWRTVSGGSREYVARLSAPFEAQARLHTAVTEIMRVPGGVVVRDAGGRAERFHHVVLATHADTSLQILGRDAGPAERSVLSAFRYQENLAVLHRDASLMPSRRGVWSSWNYLSEDRDPGGRERVSVSYWMNRLQNLRTERPVILTLNPSFEPREIEHTQTYHHPQFDTASLAAQPALPSIQGVRNTWFCGSYFGMGFHEDALRSGLEVAAALQSPAPWWDALSSSPARPGVPAGFAR